MLRQAVFAEVDDEPDYVALGWSKAFEDLTAVDAAEYCVRFGMPTEDAPAVLRGAGVFWAAMEGNLPMLRYVVETLGADLWQCNTIGVTALHMASRQGFNTVIRYIVARAGDSGSAELKACLDMQNTDPNPSPNPNPNPDPDPDPDLDLDPNRAPDPDQACLDKQTTAGMQLTAIDNAATRGHPKTVALLAELGADIHCRRANGRTPLHSAAAFGHAECVRLLLELGADPTAQAEDGSTPSMLVAEACSKSGWPTIESRKAQELLEAAARAAGPS